MQQPITKYLVFDENVKDDGQDPLLTALLKSIRTSYLQAKQQTPQQKPIGFEANLNLLAENLTNLNQRMAKAVKEIIYRYNVANPELVKTMGKKNNMPYDGDIEASKDMKFDLKNFPDTLIIVLIEFIRLHAVSNNK